METPHYTTFEEINETLNVVIDEARVNGWHEDELCLTKIQQAFDRVKEEDVFDLGVDYNMGSVITYADVFIAALIDERVNGYHYRSLTCFAQIGAFERITSYLRKFVPDIDEFPYKQEMNYFLNCLADNHMEQKN